MHEHSTRGKLLSAECQITLYNLVLIEIEASVVMIPPHLH